MWFKNAVVYKLSRDDFEVEDLQALFEDFKYTPCSKSTAKGFGWVPPIPETTNLIHYAENNLYLTAKLEEKILPTCAINEALKEAIEEKELAEKRVIKKEEKAVLKSALYQKLLAQAFSKKTIFKMVVLRDHGLIVIDTSSDKKAEELLSLLRKTLGSLPVTPLVSNKPLPKILTNWVRDQALPVGFTLGEEAELDSINEGGGIIRCKEQDLSADVVKECIKSDKLVNKLALNYQDEIFFIIDAGLHLKRLVFSSQLKYANDDIDSEDKVARFDADIRLMCDALLRLIVAFAETFDVEIGYQVAEKR